jgi:predicted nucleotidyltransferase
MNERNTLLEKEVLNVLHYFNVFHFPLSQQEIHTFLQLKCTIKEVEEAIQSLLHQQQLFAFDGIYSLENSAELVERKKKGHERAIHKIKLAKKIGKFIQLFPFVRMVAISGSLSKGYADEKSDVDFFIVTTSNNLWTCRTILHVFKKLTFLVGLQHVFCMNYFIARSHLKIEEENYFTAIELATLIPTTNPSILQDIWNKNEWMEKFLPNTTKNREKGGLRKTPFLKKSVEYLIGAKLINRFFLNWTNYKWKRKWRRKKFPMETYDLAFKTRWYVSKNHQDNHQDKTLKQYEQKKRN